MVEYKIYVQQDGNLDDGDAVFYKKVEDDLNSLAQEGWEVVCLIGFNSPSFLLKRERD